MANRYHKGNQNRKSKKDTDSDYPYGIFWPLRSLSFDLLILITPMISIGHCIVSPSSIY
jgi:hypothetical protein